MGRGALAEAMQFFFGAHEHPAGAAPPFPVTALTHCDSAFTVVSHLYINCNFFFFLYFSPAASFNFADIYVDPPLRWMATQLEVLVGSCSRCWGRLHWGWWSLVVIAVTVTGVSICCRQHWLPVFAFGDRWVPPPTTSSSPPHLSASTKQCVLGGGGGSGAA